MPLYTSIGTAFYFVGSGGYVPPITPSILFAMGANKWAGLGDNSTVDRSSPVGVSGNSWTMIAQGTVANGASASLNGITLAIKNDNTLWGWGRNYTGQFGGTTLQDYISSPVQIGTNTWSTVAVIGVDSLIGIDTTGKLYTWGRNILGSELGYYGSTGNITFTKLGSISIMNTGAAWGWGPNVIRNLISGDNTTRSYPVQIDSATTVNLGMTWLDIATSGGTNTSNLRAVGITRDTRLWSWGGGINGGLGLNDTITRSSITQIGTSTGWSKVIVCSQAGQTAGIVQGALKSDGTLWMWGINTYGWHGQNDTVNRSNPVQVSGTWLDAAAGQQIVLGIKNDGTLWSWGVGFYLGTSDLIDRSSPVQIGVDTNWQSVWSGLSQMFAIKNDGKLFAWGLGTAGQLGLGDVVARSSPVQVAVGTSFTQVVSSYQGSNAITNDGKLYGWGGGYHGDAVTRSIPVQIGSSSWTLLGTGGFGSIGDTYGLTTAGTIFGWGFNSGYELGDGTSTTTNTPISLLVNNYKQYSNSYSPVQIGTSSWASVAADRSRNVYAITAAGQLFAWGTNQYGTVGANDTVARSSPVQVKAGTSFVQVAAPSINMLALDSAYNLWTSGYNGYGSYGNNTTVSRSSPVQVTTAVPLQKLAITQNLGVLGLSQGGKLFAWGSNQFGELGLGDAVFRSSPTQIGFTYNNYSLTDSGLINDGYSLYTWGNNFNGQLGIGNTITRSSPVQVSGSYISVVKNSYNMFAIDVTGKLYASGRNVSGELGLGDAIDRSSPTQVGTESWTSISAGDSGFAVAVRSDGGLFTWGKNNVYQLGLNDTINRSTPTQIGNRLSAYFDGTNYVLLSANAAFVFGTGDFTIECWFNASSTSGVFFDVRSGLSGVNPLLYFNGSSVRYYVNGSDRITSDTTLVSNTWYHVALVRISNVSKLYLNGVQTGSSYNDSNNFSSSNNLFIGQGNSIDNSITGYISNLRVVKGVGVYTTSFTPSLYLTNITGTSLLTFQSTTFVDNSNNNFSLSVSGATISGIAYSEVSAGTSNAFTIDTNGGLYGWGDNTNGIITAPTNKSFLVVIGSATILSDNTLWTWGSNANGTLGDGTTINRSSPVQVSGNWKYVARNPNTATSLNSLGIKTDGTLWFWGVGTNGVSGNNDAITHSSPVQVGTDADWAKCFLNSNYSAFAIKTNGLLYSWGLNTFGSLGLGDVINRSSPTQVSATTSWSTITAGSNNIFGIDINSGLYGWGVNSNGEIGQNDRVNRSSPVQVAGSWVAVSALSSNVGAINSSGNLFTWGYNLNGELGQNNLISRSSPVQVGNSAWTSIHNAGGGYSAIKSGGLLYGWGGPNLVGLNDGVTRSSPTQVGSSSWSMLNSAAGYNTNGGISGNRLYNWGTNGNGYLGDNTTVTKSSPVLTVASNLSTPVFLTINSPLQIGTSSWTSVAAGDSHVMALRYGDGALFTWGKNDQGQLGLSTITSRSSPVQVGTSSWSQIGVGYSYSFGIDILGKLYSWGVNNAGQLGLNIVANRSAPVQIGTSSWSLIPSQTNNNTIAQIIDGRIFTWGTNSNGELGISNTTSRSSPVQVSTSFANFTTALSLPSSLGSTHSGFLYNNALYLWGYNGFGQLGLGDTLNRSSPSLVTTGVNVLNLGYYDTFYQKP